MAPAHWGPSRTRSKSLVLVDMVSVSLLVVFFTDRFIKYMNNQNQSNIQITRSIYKDIEDNTTRVYNIKTTMTQDAGADGGDSLFIRVTPS